MAIFNQLEFPRSSAHRKAGVPPNLADHEIIIQNLFLLTNHKVKLPRASSDLLQRRVLRELPPDPQPALVSSDHQTVVLEGRKYKAKAEGYI